MFAVPFRISLLLTALVAAAVLATPAAAHHPPTQHYTQGQEVFLADSPFMLGTGLVQPKLTSRDCNNGFAGPYPCKRVDLESAVPLPVLGIGTGNDIWGWTDPRTDREYAIMATATSTAFVDVTRPQSPRFLGQLPSHALGAFVLWRDVKVVGNHAFIVSEIGGHGMQVFDLTRLRGRTTPTIFNEDAHYGNFGNAHNIAVNPKTKFAYVVGATVGSGQTCDNGDEAGGLHMVDISRPLDPRFAGCALVEDADGDDGTESNNYVHDVECVIYDGPDRRFHGREICFGSNENAVVIYDVTNKRQPRVLSQTTYPTVGYTHQGWLTHGQRYFVFGDELDEGIASDPLLTPTVDNTTTYIMRAENLREPRKPKAHTNDTTSIDHNLYLHRGLVYQSNYSSGLRIQDFSPRSLSRGKLREVAFFDVFPPGDPNDFVGTWSNYAFFDSGTVVVSTIENLANGLFVLRPRVR